MNILVLNHYAGSPDLGMEYRPYYLAREWARLGHKVTIAAASQSHVRERNPSFRGLRKEQEIDGIQYLWFRTPSYSENGLRRFLNILAFVFQLFWNRQMLGRTCHDGYVIASSTYPLDVPLGNIIARCGKAKLIYEVHDLWPLSPIELGGMSPKHPFIRLMQWAENYAYKHAACVLSLLPMAEPHMIEHGLASGKFHYVPNGINIEEWESVEQEAPEPQESVLRGLMAAERFIVGYTGGHGLANSLHTIIEAADQVRDTRAVFVLIGQGPEKRSLEKRGSAARAGECLLS